MSNIHKLIGDRVLSAIKKEAMIRVWGLLVQDLDLARGLVYRKVFPSTIEDTMHLFLQSEKDDENLVSVLEYLDPKFNTMDLENLASAISDYHAETFSIMYEGSMIVYDLEEAYLDTKNLAFLPDIRKTFH